MGLRDVFSFTPLEIKQKKVNIKVLTVTLTVLSGVQYLSLFSSLQNTLAPGDFEKVFFLYCLCKLSMGKFTITL